MYHLLDHRLNVYKPTSEKGGGCEVSGKKKGYTNISDSLCSVMIRG